MTEREARVWVYSSLIVAVDSFWTQGYFRTKLLKANRCMISVVEMKERKKAKDATEEQKLK